MSNKDVTNPFSYSTDPELNRIFDNLVNLKTKVEEKFKKAESLLGFAENSEFIKPHDVEPLAFPRYSDMRHPYNSFTRAKSLDDIEKEVNDYFKSYEQKIKEVEEKNKPIIEHNQNIKQQVITLMTRLGINSSYDTYEYPSNRSKTKKRVTHSAGYLADLDRNCPGSNSTTCMYSLKSSMSTFQYWLKAERDKEAAENAKKDEEFVKNILLKEPKIVETLLKVGINVLSETNNAIPGKKRDVFRYCINHAIDSARKSNNQSLVDEISSLAIYI